MTEIQRTHYDAALAVAITDAERRVIEAAEAWADAYAAWVGSEHPDMASLPRMQLYDAVRALRRVRDGGHA